MTRNEGPKKPGLALEEFPYQIPFLINRALGSNKKARQARRELITGLTEFPSFGVVLTFVEHIQTVLLGAHNDKQLTSACALANDVFGAIATMIDTKGKPLLITSAVTTQTATILENDAVLKRNRFVQKHVSYSYKQKVLKAVHIISTSERDGYTNIFIGEIASPEGSEEQIRAHNQWSQTLRQTLIEGQKTSAPYARDAIIASLKEEPEIPYPVPPLYRNREGNTIALEDIEQMTYPLSEEDFQKMNALLLSALRFPRGALDHSVFAQLFFKPTVFREGSDINTFVYQSLFSNLNDWQELFYRTLVFGGAQPHIEAHIKAILAHMPNTYKEYMGPGLFGFLTKPERYDPLASKHFEEPTSPYGFDEKAVDYFLKDHQGEDTAFADLNIDIRHPYIADVVLPSLKKRLRELGVMIAFQDIMQKYDYYAQRFPDMYTDAIISQFSSTLGKDVIDGLNQHALRIQKLTAHVWELIIAQGMHFLPMATGVNTIRFDQKDPAYRLGLEEVSATRYGSSDRWNLVISFQPRGTSDTFTASLDQLGKLTLKGTLHEKAPGLAATLNHVAVLLFHDLVLQQKYRAKEAKHPPITKPTSQDQDIDQTVKKPYAHAISLPRRVQTAQDLIYYIHRKRLGYSPRVVEQHPHGLPHSHAYKDSVGEYMLATTTNAPEEEIKQRRTKLVNAQEAIFKPSPDKTIPVPGMPLGRITDPLRGNPVYLETMTDEYTSPKPTQEELKDPKKRYERVYKRSSALASLREFFLWFPQAEAT